MENPIKMDDLGIPLFLETPMSTSKQTMSRQPHLKHFFKKEAGKTSRFDAEQQKPLVGWDSRIILL